VGQAVGMARNPSAQSLDHGAGRPNKESTTTAERLSWSIYDEKVGPYGSLASLGSHSAWETQMECVLKVYSFSSFWLISGYLQFGEEYSFTAGAVWSNE
jgi:hypothetical protein